MVVMIRRTQKEARVRKVDILYGTKTTKSRNWFSRFMSSNFFIFLLFCGQTLAMPTPALRVLDHTTTYHSRSDSSGRVISSSQSPLPHNTTALKRDKHPCILRFNPCIRWESNPQFQQGSGRRPTL